jgi:hypothetical protein
LLLILKVKPEIAVQRKKEESEAAVRARSTEVWELDWSGKSAFVVDASLPHAEVIARAKALLWSHL